MAKSAAQKEAARRAKLLQTNSNREVESNRVTDFYESLSEFDKGRVATYGGLKHGRVMAVGREVILDQRYQLETAEGENKQAAAQRDEAVAAAEHWRLLVKHLEGRVQALEMQDGVAGICEELDLLQARVRELEHLQGLVQELDFWQGRVRELEQELACHQAAAETGHADN